MSFASCFERSFGGLLPITIHQFLVGPDLNSHAVDGYIELTISGGAEIGFGKMQQDGVSTAGRQPRNGVGEDSGSSVLIDSHWRGVHSGLGQIDGGRDRTVIPTAAKVLIGNEGVITVAGVTFGRTAASDGDASELPPVAWVVALA